MWRIMLLSAFAMSAGSRERISTSCDVKAVYNSLDAPLGTAALTLIGDIQEVQIVLVPAKLDPGVYAISVTRKASNVYRVDGKDMYLETRYCYEYAYSEDAVLKYESNSGYNRGELIFEN